MFLAAQRALRAGAADLASDEAQRAGLQRRVVLAGMCQVSLIGCAVGGELFGPTCFDRPYIIAVVGVALVGLQAFAARERLFVGDHDSLVPGVKRAGAVGRAVRLLGAASAPRGRR